MRRAHTGGTQPTNNDLAAAVSVAQRVLTAVRALEIEHSASPPSGIVTVSIGVTASAAAPQADQSNMLLRRADEALYRAKAEADGE